VAASAPRIPEQCPFVDAHPCLVRLEFCSPDEANVVGGDDRHTPPAGKCHGARDVALLGWLAEALQLEIETLPKQILARAGRALGIVLARIGERAADIALLGSGERDQTLERRAREPAALDTRCAALLALEIGSGEQAREVAVPGLRLAQERQA